jgi:hypothetical protein
MEMASGCRGAVYLILFQDPRVVRENTRDEDLQLGRNSISARSLSVLQKQLH